MEDYGSLVRIDLTLENTWCIEIGDTEVQMVKFLFVRSVSCRLKLPWSPKSHQLAPANVFGQCHDARGKI